MKKNKIDIIINNAIYEVKFLSPSDELLEGNKGIISIKNKTILLDKSATNLNDVIVEMLTHGVIEEFLIDTEWSQENVASFFRKYMHTISELRDQIMLYLVHNIIIKEK